MEKKWDGKTKGSLWGYKFFVFSIRFFGLNFAYFFCYFVAAYYLLFAKQAREGLILFYTDGLHLSRKEAKKMAFKNFYIFGQTLIDRIAMQSSKRKAFSFTFNNEKVLKDLHNNQQGGILISGHLGNWENAGNLIHERITHTINIVMLDAEVEKIKDYLAMQTGGPQFNLIPIKNDMSHLILMHQALKRSELLAIHADRTSPDSKNLSIDFLGKKAKFPAGPFIMAHKFKVPITFVYAVKRSKFHYDLFATDPITSSTSEMEVAEKYVKHLESMVRKYPEQWFNFFNYYAD